jgi:hypothetical protein
VSDFAYQNYSVKYTVKSEKVQTKTIEITLKNTGKEAMYSWALGFDATGKISGLKGAEVYGSEETSYILRNTEKNFELAAGKSVVISYTLTGAKLATPKAFELMSYRVFAEEGFEVKLHRDDKKIETFEGGVTVTNTGETPIEAWALSFDANFEITKLASGKALNFEDKRYTISNTNRQTPIAPGESFEVAFSAKNSAGVTPKIENVTLTKVEITAKEYANVPQIEAWAEYEEGTLTLKWESSLPVGKFTLYESADDKTYTKRIDLKNKFEYIYKYAFEKRYFKVAQTRDGITSESIAFVVEKTTDPVTGAVTFVSARPDTDGDGLENYIEDILGTDREKADTDNDGLTDYEEVYLSGSDPLIYDSIKAGVSDANADADEDGLNTKREIELGTNPLDEDSDYDGLYDGAEVNTHHTNPLKSDTDGDFIPDGDELALGLNPNSGATNGTPDNQRTTAQTIGKNSESLQYINSKSDIKYSLQITAAGLADNSLTAGESGYAAVMNNPAIIGVIPIFRYTEGLAVSEVTIAAEIGVANRANTVGTYAELNPEFEGIKRLNFFRYFEEINTLLPVETTFDISKNMMYTKTDELGTYCIMDMEIWLDSLGGAELLEAAQAETEPDTEPEAQTMRAFSAQSLGAANKVNVQPLGATMAVSPVLPGANEAVAESLANDDYDVIFLTDGTDSNPEYIDLASIYIKDDGGNVTETNISKYYYRPGNEMHGKFDVSAELLNVLNSTKYNKNRKTYIFLMVNEINVSADVPTSLGLINKLNQLSSNKPHISIVSNLSSFSEYSYLSRIIDESNGTVINTYGYTNTKDIALEIYNLIIGGAEYKYISSVGLTELPSVFNKAYLSEIYNLPSRSNDYDKDGLSDFSEIAFESGLINRTPLEMPTIEECMDYVKAVFVEEAFTRFENGEWENDDGLSVYGDLNDMIKKVRIVPIDSDPVLADGDGDGYNDFEETKTYKANPLTSDVFTASLDENYVKVNIADRILLGGNDYSYGGSQTWIYNENDKDSGDLFTYQLENGGCGIIASCDTLLYLQNYNGDISTTVPMQNGVFNWSDYNTFVNNYARDYLTPFNIFILTGPMIEFQLPRSPVYSQYNLSPALYDVTVEQLNVTIPISGIILSDIVTNGTYTWGTTLPVLTSAFNTYASEHGSSYTMTDMYINSYSKEAMEDRIYNTMLLNRPSILSLGHFCDVDYENLSLNKPDNFSKAHFMTITSIKIDKISGETEITLSTWSQKVTLSFNEFYDNAGLDGGISTIGKK